MSANALQSLIDSCSGSNPPTQIESSLDVPPIASFGFWAHRSVPLSAGVTSLPNRQPPAVRSKQAQAAPALPKMPLQEELEVRDNLALARELAQVGDNIRWDLIIGEAAKMPCALRGRTQLPAAKKATSDDDVDDHRSTSASGSGVVGETDEAEPEVETSSNDEKEEHAEENRFGNRLPPWRRQRSPKSDSDDNAVETSAANDSQEMETSQPLTESSKAIAPWRRGAAAKSRSTAAQQDESARVYSISTMLQLYLLMQRAASPSEATTATSERSEFKEEPTLHSDAPDAAKGAAEMEPKRDTTRTAGSGKACAPWRRRAKAAEASSEH